MYLAGIGARLLRSHVSKKSNGTRDNNPSAVHEPLRTRQLDLQYSSSSQIPDDPPQRSHSIINNPIEETANSSPWPSQLYSLSGIDSIRDAPDITALAAQTIGDVQGINWSSLSMTRESYRKTRMEKYQQFDSQEIFYTPVNKRDLHQVKPTNTSMKFARNIRRATPSILHFQLRHLVSALSNHSVLSMNGNCVNRCNILSNTVDTILDLTGSDIHDHIPISTIHHRNQFLYVGGFHGELIVQNMGTLQIRHESRLTNADNSISNSIATTNDMVVCANNDNFVDTLDIVTMQQKRRYDFDWAINHCTASNTGELLCMVGDNTVGEVADQRSGKVVTRLMGHQDFSFASSWHPNGFQLATGNQDRTCRVWDLRNPTTSVKILGARLSAIRSVKFSTAGEHLIVGEAADFVHIYDCKNDMSTSQQIDFFGEMAGFDISDDGRTLFIGIADHVYGSMLQYERKPMGLFTNVMI